MRQAIEMAVKLKVLIVVVVVVLYKVDRRYKMVTNGHEWSQME